MGKASIRDVANLAGVSIATVSQVLNGKGERFSDATKQKVLAARDEVGYVPSQTPRNKRCWLHVTRLVTYQTPVPVV